MSRTAVVVPTRCRHAMRLVAFDGHFVLRDIESSGAVVCAECVVCGEAWRAVVAKADVPVVRQQLQDIRVEEARALQ